MGRPQGRPGGCNLLPQRRDIARAGDIAVRRPRVLPDEEGREARG